MSLWMARADVNEEWVATGATAEEAKRNLVRAFWADKAAIRKRYPDSPLTFSVESEPRPHSVEAFEDWYGIWTYDLSAGAGVVIRDGSPILPKPRNSGSQIANAKRAARRK